MMRIFGYLIALLALGWMLHRFNSSPADWMTAAQTTSPWLMAGSILCFVSQTLLNAYAFCGYVSSTEPAVAHVRIHYAWRDSLLAKYIPGGIWQIASRWLLLMRAGVSHGLVVQASLFEQGLALGLCALLGGSFWILEYCWRVGPLAFYALLPVVIGLGFVVVRIMCRWALKLAPYVACRFGASAQIASPRAIRRMAFTMLAAMFPFALGYVLIFVPILHNGNDLLRLLSAIFLATWVGLAVLFVPGGLGLRESVLPVLFAAHSTDAAHVLSLAVVARVFVMLAEVIVFALMGRLKKAYA